MSTAGERQRSWIPFCGFVALRASSSGAALVSKFGFRCFLAWVSCFGVVAAAPNVHHWRASSHKSRWRLCRRLRLVLSQPKASRWERAEELVKCCWSIWEECWRRRGALLISGRRAEVRRHIYAAVFSHRTHYCLVLDADRAAAACSLCAQLVVKHSGIVYVMKQECCIAEETTLRSCQRDNNNTSHLAPTIGIINATRTRNSS